MALPMEFGGIGGKFGMFSYQLMFEIRNTYDQKFIYCICICIIIFSLLSYVVEILICFYLFKMDDLQESFLNHYSIPESIDANGCGQWYNMNKRACHLQKYTFLAKKFLSYLNHEH